MKQIYPAGSEPQNAVGKAAYGFALLWLKLAKRFGEFESDVTATRVSRNLSFPVTNIHIDLTDGSHNEIEIFQMPEMKDLH